MKPVGTRFETGCHDSGWTQDHESSKEQPIAKNQNTYAKQKREMDKKRKAKDKLTRRLKRKQSPETREDGSADDNAPEASDQAT